jgi:hypothetical protein
VVVGRFGSHLDLVGYWLSGLLQTFRTWVGYFGMKFVSSGISLCNWWFYRKALSAEADHPLGQVYRILWTAKWSGSIGHSVCITDHP